MKWNFSQTWICLYYWAVICVPGSCGSLKTQVQFISFSSSSGRFGGEISRIVIEVSLIYIFFFCSFYSRGHIQQSIFLKHKFFFEMFYCRFKTLYEIQMKKIMHFVYQIYLCVYSLLSLRKIFSYDSSTWLSFFSYLETVMFQEL